MLLDTTPGTFQPFKAMSVAASAIGAALLALAILSVFARTKFTDLPAGGPVPSLKDYAEQLFTTYLLPVQVVGFLLLIAMLGVIVLSKKFAPVEDAP